MPGIVGLFSPGRRPATAALIGQMTEALTHGPHQRATTSDFFNLILGRVDLGVFARNLQPKDSGEVIALIWGELSNSQAERQESLRPRSAGAGAIDDVDFLLGLYARHREHFARMLHGSFNALIFDKTNQRLLIATDRLGLRPLYYSSRGGTIAFASGVRALLKSRRGPLQDGPPGGRRFPPLRLRIGRADSLRGHRCGAAGFASGVRRRGTAVGKVLAANVHGEPPRSAGGRLCRRVGSGHSTVRRNEYKRGLSVWVATERGARLQGYRGLHTEGEVSRISLDVGHRGLGRGTYRESGV